MAACTIFEEDEVCIVTEKGIKCGLVLESSENISSSEEDDEEEELFFERVKKGTMRVAWHPNGEEEVVQERQMQLMDRSLMPGDVVRRLIEGQDSQRGYVCHTAVNTHVQLIGKHKGIISNIDSQQLVNLRPWDDEPGDVYLDSWVGKIERIMENITFRFADGARCLLNDEEMYPQLSSFEDIHEKRDRESEFGNNDYYVGQQLRGPFVVLESVTWLNTTKRHNMNTAKKHAEKDVIVTVDEITAAKLEVYWLCRGYSKADHASEQRSSPPKVLTGDYIKRLRKLDCFDSCSIQIGDKMVYVIKGSDEILEIPPKGRKTLLSELLPKRSLTSQRDLENTLNAKNCDNMRKSILDAVLTSSRETSAAIADENEPVLISAAEARENGPCDLSGGLESSALAKDEAVGPDGTGDGINGEQPSSCSSKMDALRPPGKDAPVAAGANHGGGDSDAGDSVDESVEDEDDQSDLSSASNSSVSVPSSESDDSQSNREPRKGPAVQAKLLKKKKLKMKRVKRKFEMSHGRGLKPGDCVAVEVICTLSSIDVMWQDGSLEKGIPSTELYPIHHLDELEFFPGDFVVPSADVTEPGSYGVVVSVDHAGRVCKVVWMEPYQEGITYVLDETPAPEEVSVYDIKDHSDYKFRPGHVVVRVGGYKEEHSTEAAGQVFKIGPHGQLLIQWADGVRSWCFPQELYQLMDLNDSELDSDSEDSESEDDASQSSWETAEEETDHSADDEEEGDDEEEEAHVDDSEDKLHALAEQKVDLDQMLESVKTTLQKLKETFGQNVDLAPYAIHCYKEILYIYRSCRNLDRMMNQAYFDDEHLVDTVATIKTELKKEKSAKISKQVMELFESNCRQGKTACASITESGAKGESGTADGTQAAASGASGTLNSRALQTPMQASVLKEIQDIVKKSTGVHETNDGVPELVNGSLGTGEGMPKAAKEVEGNDVLSEGGPLEDARGSSAKVMAEGDVFSQEVMELSKELMELEMKLEERKPKLVTTETAPFPRGSDVCMHPSGQAEEDVGMEAAAPREVAQESCALDGTTVGTEGVHAAKELCEKACHLLREQIIKVHSDLEEKWQKLRKSDKLKVTGKEEDEEEGEEKADATNGPTDDNNVGAETNSSADRAETNIDVTRKTNTMSESNKTNLKSEVSGSGVKQEKGLSDCIPDKICDKDINSRKSPTTGGNHSQTGSSSGGRTRARLDLPIGKSRVGKKAEEMEQEWAEELLAQTPDTPQTPADIRAKLEINTQGFTVVEEATTNHQYYGMTHEASEPRSFMTAVGKEQKLLHSGLPKGIHVKSYEDRIDLYTVMIKGPTNTPYEDGLFFFDVQLPNDYPNAPPSVHYISYCTDRLNPNLYEDGKVCVSLLGTWTGKGTEMWTGTSSLLQVLISIQGLILVSEPYYNEAGYEKQKGSQQGLENSRMYNEMAILKLVQSMRKILVFPPAVYGVEVADHMSCNAYRMIRRLEYWLSASEKLSHQVSSADAEAGAFTSSSTASPRLGSSSPEPASAAAATAAVSCSGDSHSSCISSEETGGRPTLKPVKEDSAVEHCDLPKTQGPPLGQDLHTPSSCMNPDSSPKEPDAASSKLVTAPGSLKGIEAGGDGSIANNTGPSLPEFPLLPTSRGFQITMRKHLDAFRKALLLANIAEVSDGHQS